MDIGCERKSLETSSLDHNPKHPFSGCDVQDCRKSTWENKGNYHHPTRQRGILGNTLETQKRNPSLTRRDYRKCATSKSLSEGSKFVAQNPSRTFQIGVSSHGNIGKLIQSVGRYFINVASLPAELSAFFESEPVFTTEVAMRTKSRLRASS